MSKNGDKSLNVSIPDTRVLHGVTIKRLPVGKYVKVMKVLENIPKEILTTLYPNLSFESAFSGLLKADADSTVDFILDFIVKIPERAMRLLSELLDIDISLLLDTEAGLTLTELAEIIAAFVNMNDMTGFFKVVRRLTNRPTARKTGSSAGSQSEKA